jgi:hypothetical protein
MSICIYVFIEIRNIFDNYLSTITRVYYEIENSILLFLICIFIWSPFIYYLYLYTADKYHSFN